MRKNRWDDSEVEILISNRDAPVDALLKLLQNRSFWAIRAKTKEIGIRRRWTFPKKRTKREPISSEHRKHLSESIKKWWDLNKKLNPEFIKWRNEQVAKSLRSKPRLDLRHPTGKSPPNKGVRTGTYKKCEVCGKEFYVIPSARNRRFCSQKCMFAFLRQKGGWHYLHPTANWYRQKIVDLIGKCEECGFADKRILTVHHKDGNKKNRRRQNLLVLCPNCHMAKHLVNGKLDLHGWHKLLAKSVLSGDEW